MANREIDTILIVGLGSIGRKHLKLLRKISSSLNIIALSNNVQYIHTYRGLNRIVSNIDEALSYSPSAAILCNPASQHVEVARSLIDHGVNVLIEKPISNSSEGVKDLIDMSRHKNCKLMIGYNLRFSKSLLFFKKKIDMKAIGKLLSVRSVVGQHLTSWRPDSDYTQSVSARKALGGGVLLELSHEIDYLSWIFGSIDEVFGQVNHASSLDIDVEDIVHTLVKFKNSRICSDLTANLTMDFIRRDPIRQCTVVGEEGTLKWDAINDKVFLYEQDKWELIFEPKSDLKSDYSYTDELLHFIECIEMDKQPSITGKSALDTIYVIDAIRLSSETKKTVKVDYNHSR